MGLDIEALSRLRKIDAVFNRVGDPIDPVSRAELDGEVIRINRHFPGRGAPLEDGAVYVCDGLRFGFRAGSYGGYNEWRRQLSALAGYSSADDCFNGAIGPFSDLINFSDCEGTIGSESARKLVLDFAHFDEAASRVRDRWFYPLYLQWHWAFALAADDGAVIFA